jgi:hypothetical protein
MTELLTSPSTTSKLLFTSTPTVNIVIDGIYSCFCHNNYASIELFDGHYTRMGDHFQLTRRDWATSLIRTKNWSEMGALRLAPSKYSLAPN